MNTAGRRHAPACIAFASCVTRHAWELNNSSLGPCWLSWRTIKSCFRMSADQRPPRKARRLPNGNRAVTRAEFERVIDLLNTRGEILNEIRKTLDIQFKRIAQIQAELDAMRRTHDASSTRRRR
jgi:hypothetical protein